MNNSEKIILFDLANTLLYKPKFFEQFIQIVQREGYLIDERELTAKHKWLSEVITFPDKTSAEFYADFNAKLLLSLGIKPDVNLLESIFKACSYLPWEVFSDTEVLKRVSQKKAILSNWDSSVSEKVEAFFPDMFKHIIGSEISGLRKPDSAFFKLAIEELGVTDGEIIYIGDSLKLDVFPALELGMDAYLIDRNNDYPLYKGKKMNSLADLLEII